VKKPFKQLFYTSIYWFYFRNTS